MDSRKEIPADIEKPYGLILTHRADKSPPIEKRFGKLQVYCSPCPINNYLYHGNYRLMKKADLTFIDFIAHNFKKRGGWDYFPDELELFRESRVFSNGNIGVIIPKRYYRDEEIHGSQAFGLASF